MVTYRLSEEKDYININNFYNRIYKAERTLEQFYWEFHNCPFGKSIYVIAEDDEKIIGTNCVIPINLIDQNKNIILSGKSEDTLVDPEYRGQNIFYNIYDVLFSICDERGINIIWGFTSAEKPFKKIGFSIPFNHEQSLIVNNIWKSYKYLSSLNSNNSNIKNLKILLLCFVSKFKFMLGNINCKNLKYKVIVDDVNLDQLNRQIENNISKEIDSFQILQSPEYLKWRIYSNPNYFKVHTYSFYDNNEKLIGCIILNSNLNSVAYIIQSIFNNHLSSTDKIQMLKYVVKNLFSLGICIIRNWHFETNTFNKNEIEIYQKANFMRLKKGICFVWKDNNSNKINPFNFNLSRLSSQGTN